MKVRKLKNKYVQAMLHNPALTVLLDSETIDALKAHGRNVGNAIKQVLLQYIKEAKWKTSKPF